MKHKRASPGRRSIERQPFSSFQVEISQLQISARHGEDPAERNEAADRLIAKTRALKAEVKSVLALPETQRKFDTAKFALMQVVSAKDPEIRALAFESMEWDAIALRSFTSGQYPADIRRMARERLEPAKRRSNLLKEEQSQLGADTVLTTTWRFGL